MTFGSSSKNSLCCVRLCAYFLLDVPSYRSPDVSACLGEVRVCTILATVRVWVVCVVSRGCETWYHIQVYIITHKLGHLHCQLY